MTHHWVWSTNVIEPSLAVTNGFMLTPNSWA
jgi:hypothetical protein